MYVQVQRLQYVCASAVAKERVFFSEQLLKRVHWTQRQVPKRSVSEQQSKELFGFLLGCCRGWLCPAR